MTVQELFDVCESPIKVKSAYNDKVLCYEYSPDKHGKLCRRMVVAVWADLENIKSTFGNYAKAKICAYVEGSEEAEKEWKKKNDR